MNRILVVRGGAIGDFILTLPAIGLLREHFPNAHIEVLGRPHIAALAEKRFYADAVRSLDSASLASFFAEGAVLPPGLMDYFASFDLILSYLHDPDGIFAVNCRRCGTAQFLAAPSKLDDGAHAAVQLARPLAKLGLQLRDPAARLYPTGADRAAVRNLLSENPCVVIHPGSGSKTKNWPLTSWGSLGDLILQRGYDLIVVAGEADTEQTAALEMAWAGRSVRFAANLSLPHLAALLEGQFFLGHDSGISHIAAAVQAYCLLLFGPTDPAVWAPANKDVTALRADRGKMSELRISSVAAALWPALRA